MQILTSNQERFGGIIMVTTTIEKTQNILRRNRNRIPQRFKSIRLGPPGWTEHEKADQFAGSQFEFKGRRS